MIIMLPQAEVQVGHVHVGLDATQIDCNLFLLLSLSKIVFIPNYVCCAVCLHVSQSKTIYELIKKATLVRFPWHTWLE